MSETIEQQHLRLAKESTKPCASDGCAAQPTKIRYWPNPRWGLGPNGQINDESLFLSEVHALIRWPWEKNISFTLDQVRAFCPDHYPAEETKLSGKPDQPNRRAEFKQLRQTAFDVYGRTCSDCGKTPDSETSLRLCLADDQPADLWSYWGVQGWNQRHEWLAAQGWDPKLCKVRCIDCFSKKVQSGRGLAKLALRDQVISAYGGQCQGCGDDQQQKLWLVRLSGPVLRWGDSGRKLTSKQKYELLLRLGCPDSHGLLCPVCWKSSRQGQGSGHLGDD